MYDRPYAATIGELHTETLIPYTKVTSIHYQTLPEQDKDWNIDVKNLFVRSLQSLLLLFLDKRGGFANKNEEFYSPSIKRFLITINVETHQLLAAGL